MEMKKREQIRDYVLLMLGAPVIKVELTEEHLNLCVDLAESDTSAYFEVTDIGERHYYDLVQDRAMSKALGILSRIRGKYNFAPGPDGKYITLDAKQLRQEAHNQNLEWHYKVDSLKDRHRLNHDGDPTEWWKDGRES